MQLSEDLIDHRRAGPVGLVHHLTGFVDDVDPIGHVSMSVVNGTVHAIQHDRALDVEDRVVLTLNECGIESRPQLLASLHDLSGFSKSPIISITRKPVEL